MHHYFMKHYNDCDICLMNSELIFTLLAGTLAVESGVGQQAGSLKGPEPLCHRRGQDFFGGGEHFSKIFKKIF